MLVDYAFPPHPSPAALRAAGATGVSRYLSRMTVSAAPKVITGPEYQQLLAAGLDVVLNWEYDARDYLGGAMAGANHAREAAQQAQAIGYPRGCAIIGSADADVTRADWLGNGRPYYSAFSTGLRIAGYRPGIYGPYDVLAWAREDGVADVYWQAGMSTAWSQGRNYHRWPGAHLRQRRQVIIGGADCDVNDILQADYGQTGGTNMALTDAQTATLLRLLVNVERLLTVDHRVLDPADTGIQMDPITGLDFGDGHLHQVPNVVAWQRARFAEILAAIEAGPVTLTAEQVDRLGTLIGAAVGSPITQLATAVKVLTDRLAAAGHELANPPV